MTSHNRSRLISSFAMMTSLSVILFFGNIGFDKSYMNYSFAFFGGDLVEQNFESSIGTSNDLSDLKIMEIMTSSKILHIDNKTIQQIFHSSNDDKIKRYIVFGIDPGKKITPYAKNMIYSLNINQGFFSVGMFTEGTKNKLERMGYHVIEDFKLDFHSDTTKRTYQEILGNQIINGSKIDDINDKSLKNVSSKNTTITTPLVTTGTLYSNDKSANNNEVKDASNIGEITGSTYVQERYGYNGSGVKIAIVDTGVDFSNPDIQHSLARDKQYRPIMLDTDGQGIVLTNATFIANIDKHGVIRNYTKKADMPDNITSTIYKTKDGVFLDINQKGNGIIIQIYNSLFPQGGTTPVFNATLQDDMKIGKNGHDYIVSMSGIYHLGVLYQGILQGPLTGLQVVPVLVVDSTEPGIYDTIIPDMSTSWKDYTRSNLPGGKEPVYDFDFTDEVPIKLGNGKEFLVYDHNDDNINDYSAGTVGARIVDIYNVTKKNKTTIIQDTLKPTNGTLLPALDPNGEFFGVMTDFLGHGTASAASITSRGVTEYNIYNDTKRFTITGVAPGAKIIPVKSLWFGDSLYAWLWTAGFDKPDPLGDWEYSGATRADIISNSWGVSNFPLLKRAPGLDILSLVQSVLTVPHSIDQDYPGVVMVSSAGNSGHGYGTMGTPNASPFGITVGATTNNVFVGYGQFKDQPRFGSTYEHRNDMVDFSSRGPSIIGDPKPDIVSIGAYGFVPTTITNKNSDEFKESFSLYGGTSMAAPLVSGTASLIIQALRDSQMEEDPFLVKNILMSTATDLYNDPFTQGAGIANATKAIQSIKGEENRLIIHNNASYQNIKDVLNDPIRSVNETERIGPLNLELSKKTWSMTPWFAGHLAKGQRSTTTFTVENLGNTPVNDIMIAPKTLKLIKRTEFYGTTIPQEQDPILNKSGVYKPNYVRLSDVRTYKTLADYFNYSYNIIPNDADLLILNVNFRFTDFMNDTGEKFADDLKIASLYLYDWHDKNNDTKISSDELSMVNKGGTWGTVQEMRVSQPNSRFNHEPIVGIYPVPNRYSYWLGQTPHNSTEMNYTITASYYTKDDWKIIWTSDEKISIPPKNKTSITATVFVPYDYPPGVYQGFVSFEENRDNRTVNVPVSFVVKEIVNEIDSLLYIAGNNNTSNDILYGNGYVKGAFDMVNRYMAGDWRYYHFEINDTQIDTGFIRLSWEDNDTSLSVFVVDPQGRIVKTNAPSGIFGEFMSWPTNDWLGITPFSQGGGFYHIGDRIDNSAILDAPINQTGTYSLMIHSTLFGGEKEIKEINSSNSTMSTISTTEPFSIVAKFTNLSPFK